MKPISTRTPNVLFDVVFPVQAMPRETLRAGNIAIRLHGPSANDFPPALPDPAANFLQHPRVRALHPSVVNSGGVAITEIGRFVHPIKRTAERIENFILRIAPRP